MGNQQSTRSADESAYLEHILDGKKYVHPLYSHQQVIKTDNWTFDSAFESGNLEKVEQTGPNSFDFWVAPDNWKSAQQPTKHGNAFYFAVIPTKPLKGDEQRKIHLRLRGDSRKDLKQLHNGMVPVYKSLPHNSSFKYVPTKMTDIQCNHDDEVSACFEFLFTEKDQKVFFAYTVPYTYSDTIQEVDALTKKYCDDDEIYFHRELLTLTPENRRIDLLTITAQESNISNLPKEEVLENLFPLHTSEAKEQLSQRNVCKKLTTRPPKFNKEYIFFTCRIHASEAPGSWMLHSFLHGLLDKKDPISKKLLEKYVFCVIPILNADGVARGHSRMDIKKEDPNHRFTNPTHEEDPIQYAVVQLAKEFGKERRLWMYMDFHAHANKNAAFVFGTTHKGKDSKEHSIASKSFIRVLDMWSNHFDIDESGWNPVDHTKPLDSGVSKNAVMYYSHCPHSYTIEASYHHGTKDSDRYQKYSMEDLKKIRQLKYQKMGVETGQPEIPFDSVDMDYYLPKIHYQLEVNHFKEIGDCLRHAILDFQGLHPNSKLPNTCFKNLETLNEFIRKTPVVDTKNKKKTNDQDHKDVKDKKDIHDHKHDSGHIKDKKGDTYDHDVSHKKREIGGHNDKKPVYNTDL